MNSIFEHIQPPSNWNQRLSEDRIVFESLPGGTVGLVLNEQDIRIEATTDLGITVETVDTPEEAVKTTEEYISRIQQSYSD